MNYRDLRETSDLEDSRDELYADIAAMRSSGGPVCAEAEYAELREIEGVLFRRRMEDFETANRVIPLRKKQGWLR